MQDVAHAEDARFPPSDDLAYLCHGHREGDYSPALLENRDTARKKKEKAKRDEERRIKWTQHTRDIRSLLVRVGKGGDKK
jgi:hypothetical protein